MAVNYYIDGVRAVLVVRARGRWRSGALLDTLHRVVADPRYRSDQQALVDCRRSEFFGSSEDFRGVAQFVASYLQGRTAVVVDTDVGWGLTRMVMALAADDGTRMRPFRDFPAAALWLGCPDLPDHALLGQRNRQQPAAAGNSDQR